MAGAIELVESGLEVAGRSQNQDVEHEPERSQLFFLALPVALTELTAVPMEEPPGQAVTGLVAVELDEDVPTVGGTADELEQVERLRDPAELGEGAGQGGRARDAPQRAQEGLRRGSEQKTGLKAPTSRKSRG